MNPPPRSALRRLVHAIHLEWMLAAAFLVLMLALLPFVDRFEFDMDEGILVMKSMLVADGYPLYSVVWSDQAPLLSEIVAVAFRAFGCEILVARLIVLLFSCLLLWSCARILRLLGGPVVAAVGALLIVSLPYHLKLSISAMLGLPAHALAAFALAALASWHRTGSRAWLATSGVALGLGILTKLYVVVLAPVIGVGLVLVAWRNRASMRRALTPLALWILGLAATGGVVYVLWLGPEAIDQLTAPHLAAQDLGHYRDVTLFRGLREYWAILVVGGLGACLALRRRRWLAGYLVGWMTSAIVTLSTHVPVWYHHLGLVLTPAAMLAAFAVGELLHGLRRWRESRRWSMSRAALNLAIAAGVGIALIQQAPTALCFERGRRSDGSSSPRYGRGERRIVETMRRNADRTRWVVTDRPMFAFRAGLRVPPGLAVVSMKRTRSGLLTEEMVWEEIRRRKPEQILLARFRWPSLRARLDAEYRAIRFGSGRRTLYLGNGLERDESR